MPTLISPGREGAAATMSKMRRSTAPWLLLVLAGAVATRAEAAPPLKVRPASPGVFVTAIAVGTDGFLWVGTRRGLLCFDGVRFTAAAGQIGRAHV